MDSLVRTDEVLAYERLLALTHIADSAIAKEAAKNLQTLQDRED